MLFRIASEGGVEVVTLKGRLDSRGGEACAARLLPLVEEGRRIVLDLAEVDYVGGAGLRILMMLTARAAALGRAVRIRAPSAALTEAVAVAGTKDLLHSRD